MTADESRWLSIGWWFCQRSMGIRGKESGLREWVASTLFSIGSRCYDHAIKKHGLGGF